MFENGQNILKTREKGLNPLKTYVSFTKCLEKLINNKDRHLVDVKLEQQDKKSTLYQL